MSDGAVFTPSNQLFVFNAIPLTFSRAAGTYFTFAYDRPDRVTTVPSVDGTGYYVTHGSLSATMTLVVLPNGEENDILAAAFIAQQVADLAGAPIKFPILCERGLAQYTGFGRIAAEPPLEFSDAATTNTWKIVSTRMFGRQGGMPSAIVAPPS